jgi:FtsZ-binding cell division protein ZapB
MTKDEMKSRISMALKDPILQQGFEIICKNLSELEKENAELKETCNKWFEHLKLFNLFSNRREEELLNELNNQNAKYESQIEELKEENTELEKENAELREKVERYYCLLEKSMDCETCKYCDLSDDREEEPCKSCFFDSSKWELKDD